MIALPHTLQPGCYGASFEYRTPCGGIGYYRGVFRGEICAEEVEKRIRSNPHRKFSGGLKLYQVERIGS